MKKIQMVTVFNDSVGLHIGTDHAVIENSKIVERNIRSDFLITDPDLVSKVQTVLDMGQSLIDNGGDMSA